MEVKFLFNNVNVSARTREYTRTRLESVQKLLGDDADASFIEIEMGKDKRGSYCVNVMIKTPHTSYRSENVGETIEEATDSAEEEVKRQIRERKEKRETLMKRGARSIKKKLTIDDSARF